MRRDIIGVVLTARDRAALVIAAVVAAVFLVLAIVGPWYYAIASVASAVAVPLRAADLRRRRS